MISIIQGDALSFDKWNVLAHGCNTLNCFGAGIARAIKDKYPEAFEADNEAHKNRENMLGAFSLANLSNGNKIVNLYIQCEIGTDSRKVHYEALYTSLELLCDMINAGIDRGNKYTLALPWVGCGLAGGNRKIVQAMVEVIFSKAKFDVYIVELN